MLERLVPFIDDAIIYCEDDIIIDTIKERDDRNDKKRKDNVIRNS